MLLKNRMSHLVSFDSDLVDQHTSRYSKGSYKCVATCAMLGA